MILRELGLKPQLKGPLLTVLAACLRLVACSGPTGVEKGILLHIQRTCADRQACVVNLKDATPFEWDKMYVFKYTANQAEIEKAIGTRLNSYREFRRQLIFTKAGAVVHSEDEPTNVEHPIKNEVVFAMPDTVNYKIYGADVSFTVSQETSEAGLYYILQPTK